MLFAYSWHNFSHRTKEEEARVFRSQRIIESFGNETDYRALNATRDNSLPIDEKPLLSTELCMYIHGSLMAGLFLFGITR